LPRTIAQALSQNLLGNSPDWYKLTIIGFLLLNPVLLNTVGPFITGWVLIGEFIFTLAMALKCYPLPAGGLLAIEAVALGMASPATVYQETLANFPVILLLMFMVAGIYFMKDMLTYAFTKVLLNVRSKVLLSLVFVFMGAFLSAFLDALTVTAVIITVAYGFYDVYHRYASGGHGPQEICQIYDEYRDYLKEFRGFLRNLMMHGAVGTALGGVCTLVGEPQNLLIGHVMGWHFDEFFIKVAPVSMPVLGVGLVTTIVVEKFRLFGYGHQLPQSVHALLAKNDRERDANMSKKQWAAIFVQGCAGVYLIFALAFHIAEVGIIGLSVIIALTALNGITEEHRIGRAFEEALPFTALLVVFFAIVAVIHEQHLFTPVIQYVLSLTGKTQLAAYYLANGLLSMISDNVFVATVYISETKIHFVNLLGQIPGIEQSGEQLMSMLTDPNTRRTEVLAGLPGEVASKAGSLMHQFDRLAVAINTGTNIPSVATPNGQAAFLFLLTSTLAPVIRLSYGRMVMQAFPYTITMTLSGLAATWWLM
jgi:Na+:H+ antiporter, NhaB family